MKIEMAVDDKDAGAVIGMICEMAQTGEVWDGKKSCLYGGGHRDSQDGGRGDAVRFRSFLDEHF